jgi:mono/diheme cytochrome c family protein
MQRIATALLMAFGLSTGAWAADEQTAPQKRGETLVVRNCSACHAVGATGASPHPEAPPFRILGRRYPLESLEEALGEGIVAGHPDMPEFKFEAADVGAVIAYLNFIQEQ